MRPPSAAAERCVLGLVAVMIASVAGCRGDGASPADDAAPPAPLAREASAPPPPPSHDPRAARPSEAAGAIPCRVMAAENGPSPSADATSWLDVATKGSFTVKIVESGRELRFEGPGHIRPCAVDVALVAEGSAVGLPGSGEGPGSEQWVATACGVVRWASGVHRVTGGRDGCKLQSSLGTAHLFAADDVTLVAIEEPPPDGGAGASVDAGAQPHGQAHAHPHDGWQRIDAKRALQMRSRKPLDDAAAVKTALAACEKAAQAAQALSARMNEAGPSDAGLGELAEKSVSARGAARATCAVAATRIELAGAGPEPRARLDAASARWRR